MTADLNYSTMILTLVLFIILLSFWRAHRDPNINFNFYDFILENGRPSKLSFVLMGAFLVTTWIVFHLTLSGKITEGYFTIYGGLWIAPILTRIMKGDSAAPAPASDDPPK
jgi:hypothetical protein